MSKKFPRFPAHIRIAGDDHTVELVKPHPGLSNAAIGGINHGQYNIVIDVTQRPDRMRKVLLHELIHGADAKFGLNDMTEAQVNSLENGLWAIFKDNPGLAGVVFGED